MEFCKRFGYEGLDFRMLPADPDFYYFKVSNIVESDGSHLRREKYCDICKNYQSVVPGYPVHLKTVKEPLIDSFFATDIHFGNGNGKAPSIIIGMDTYKKVTIEKFRGISLKKVEI